MDKTLIRVGLEKLSTNDDEVIGSVFRRNGKVYRWVKNAGSTGLVAQGACLTLLTSVEASFNKRVISPDTGGATAEIFIAAGSPMTAIGPSGSDTGDHGWVQCKGLRKVSIFQSSAALAPGELAVATASQPATAPWGMSYSPQPGSDVAANLYAKRVEIMHGVATTGPATAASALVDIQCM